MKKILILLLIVLGASCSKMPVERSITGLVICNINYDDNIISLESPIPSKYKFRGIERKIYSDYIEYHFNQISENSNKAKQIIFKICKNGESFITLKSNDKEYSQKCVVNSK